MDHQPIHPPIYPGTLGVFGNHGMPSTDIAAAVTAMNQRNRKLEDVDSITDVDVFLARPGFYQSRGNRFFPCV